MGFGSYDESEQENQNIEADLDEENGVSPEDTGHDGNVEYEMEASNDELLSTLKDIKEDEAS